jgi:hypothetical protein
MACSYAIHDEDDDSGEELDPFSTQQPVLTLPYFILAGRYVRKFSSTTL